jgi:hypothetical protein
MGHEATSKRAAAMSASAFKADIDRVELDVG